MKLTVWEIIFCSFAAIGLILTIIGWCRQATRWAWDKKQPFESDNYLKDEHPNKAEKRDNLTDKLFIRGILLFGGSLVAIFCYLLFVEHVTF